VKAVLEEDEFGILEVIQKLKEKYDLREEVEKLPDIGWSKMTEYAIRERPNFR